jgi:hypothetical protein
VLDQRLLARAVAAVHAADLRDATWLSSTTSSQSFGK